MKVVKCLTVGDGSIGKTCMLVTYTTKLYEGDYIPTILDRYTAVIKEENESTLLELWDTAGQEDYKHLRPLTYPHTDVVLICFSIADPITLRNVEHNWVPEIRHFCSKSIIILVGTKLDLRQDPKTIDSLKEVGQHPVTQKQGEELAETIGAYKYLECSSLTKVGLLEVFDAVLESDKLRKLKMKKPPKRCSLL